MEFEKSLSKIFKDKDILSVENFYKFIDRKKIIVFVPLNFIDKLTLELSNAGAGLIDNYEMCSFRSEGTGTFKPDEKAKPFSGKKNLLSYEKEFKLEMECDSGKLNKVIDALLKHHPYEEPVYEIYDFRKRDKASDGIIVNLKRFIKLREIVKRLNLKIEICKTDLKSEIRKIAITSYSKENEILINSARLIYCDCMILVSKNNYKLFKIF